MHKKIIISLIILLVSPKPGLATDPEEYTIGNIGVHFPLYGRHDMHGSVQYYPNLDNDDDAEVIFRITNFRKTGIDLRRVRVYLIDKNMQVLELKAYRVSGSLNDKASIGIGETKLLQAAYSGWSPPDRNEVLAIFIRIQGGTALNFIKHSLHDTKQAAEMDKFIHSLRGKY